MAAPSRVPRWTRRRGRARCGDVPAGAALTLMAFCRRAWKPSAGTRDAVHGVPDGAVARLGVVCIFRLPGSSICCGNRRLPLPKVHPANITRHGPRDADLAGLRELQRGDPPQRVVEGRRAWRRLVHQGIRWRRRGGAVTLAWSALPPR
jgi:hypothetical protein